jgi:hypothetical protein
VNHVTVKNLRLEIPAHTNPILADLMRKCWQTDPTARPDFNEVRHILCEPFEINFHQSLSQFAAYLFVVLQVMASLDELSKVLEESMLSAVIVLTF